MRYKVILTYGTKIKVKAVYGIEQARDYAAIADKATIIDTWKNKIVKQGLTKVNLYGIIKPSKSVTTIAWSGSLKAKVQGIGRMPQKHNHGEEAEKKSRKALFIFIKKVVDK